MLSNRCSTFFLENNLKEITQNMMNNLKNIFILLIATAIITSCSKKCDCPAPIVPTTPTKTTLLINKNWQKIMHTKTVGTDAAENLYAKTPQCEKDDIIMFSATSTEATSGNIVLKVNVKCNTEIDTTTPWFFNTEKTEIISEGQILKIIELTTDILKVSFSETKGGVTTVETITFGKLE